MPEEQVRITLQLKGAEGIRQVEATGTSGTCRSCGAAVVFVTQANGKTPPYNPDGVTHFASCPHAATWRGKSKAKA